MTTPFVFDWRRELIAIIRGFRNGVVYGFKIRLPHAFVMTMLFRNGTLHDKLRAIIKATYTHSKNLGLYVLTFKIIRMLMRYFRAKEDHFNTIVAGLVGGAFIFGKNDPISSQINMYVMSRIIFGFSRTLLKHNVVNYYPQVFTAFAGFVWSAVMYLHFYEPKTLQSSLAQSMKYLYEDSEVGPKGAKNIFQWFLM